jgi:hypothetical protein
MQAATRTAQPHEHRRHHPVRHFVRHYVEMVVAMLAGMAVLWIPFRLLLGAFGMSGAELHDDAPALMLGGMAATMTVPMVGWMRFRGHRWAACNDMTLAMVLPTLAAIGLLAIDAVTDVGALMVIEHTAMFSAMLVAMLLRRYEYTVHA